MLDLRPEIEKLVDTLDEKGFDDAIYYLGIGGTRMLLLCKQVT